MYDGISKEDQEMVDQIKAALSLVMNLPDPDKSRCLLSLAYEYFLMEMEEEAYKLLMHADPNYFSAQLKEDMKTIPNMDQIVTRIAGKLIELGVITIKFNGEDS